MLKKELHGSQVELFEVENGQNHPKSMKSHGFMSLNTN